MKNNESFVAVRRKELKTSVIEIHTSFNMQKNNNSIKILLLFFVFFFHKMIFLAGIK